MTSSFSFVNFASTKSKSLALAISQQRFPGPNGQDFTILCSDAIPKGKRGLVNSKNHTQRGSLRENNFEGSNNKKGQRLFTNRDTGNIETNRNKVQQDREDESTNSIQKRLTGVERKYAFRPWEVLEQNPNHQNANNKKVSSSESDYSLSRVDKVVKMTKQRGQDVLFSERFPDEDNYFCSLKSKK